MQWRVPFGVVAALVGAAFLYATFAPLPFVPVTPAGVACELTGAAGVHVASDWTLQYRDACGDFYPYARLASVAFVVVGTILLGGGLATIRDAR